VETGTCLLQIGASSADIRLSAEIPVVGECIPPRNPYTLTYAQNYDAYSSCYLHERRGSDIPAVCAKTDGAWMCYRTVDFDSGYTLQSDPLIFTADISTSGAASLELRLGSPDGICVSAFDLPNTGDNCAVPWNRLRPLWTTIREPVSRISGTQDLYIIFHGTAALQSFRFE
jgi:hypothetical protein